METEVLVCGTWLQVQVKTIELINEICKQHQLDLYTTADELIETFTQHEQLFQDTGLLLNLWLHFLTVRTMNLLTI